MNYIYLILLTTCLASGMLVKDWGTGVQMKRLAYSVRDLFLESFNFFTAAQNGVYPIEDFKINYTQVWHGTTAEVIFMAYNGWLEELKINTKSLEEHGKLRRMIMTSAEKSTAALQEHSAHEYQHEIIICDACLTLHAKRVHYAYETVFYNYETSGTFMNDEISALLSFQLTISSGHNKTIGKDYCLTQLEPILLVPLTSTNATSLNQFSIKMTNIGIFNFLAEHIDTWMQQHFNAVVFRSIQKKLDVSLRKMLNLRNPCEQFLSA